MEIRFIVSQSASCFHAADAAYWGATLTDEAVAAAIQGPLETLRGEMDASQIPPARFWHHIVPLAAGIESNHQLADVVQRKILAMGKRSESLTARLAGLFSDLENAFRSAVPGLVDELSLRARPLQEQWQARGPGMLKFIASLTSERLIADRADVVLVQPVLGGMASAHLPYNSARIEAVLANPHAQLPETVRLAWVLAQLNLDLPVFSELIHGDRLPLIGQLAMLPFALKAAEHVELATSDEPTVQLAVQAWQIGRMGDLALPAGDVTDVIMSWFTHYLDARGDWAVALTALDRMLSAER
jgi:hypothetical protein